MKFVSYVLSVFLYTIPILLFLAAVAGVLYASEHLPGWFILPCSHSTLLSCGKR